YGTGFHGTISDEVAHILQTVNSLSAYRIACDIPSGIDSRGIVAKCADGTPVAFLATRTVTMGGYKAALFSDAAKAYTGHISRGSIGVSPATFDASGKTPYALLETADMQLPHRTAPNAHKGTFGHLAVITGEKPGAAIIAGSAALAFGCGCVTLVNYTNTNTSMAPAYPPELLYASALPKQATTVVVGPGLGRSDSTLASICATIYAHLSRVQNAALVLDADVCHLQSLQTLLDDFASRIPAARVVLTPHPKEFQALLKNCLGRELPVDRIITERLTLVQQFTERFPQCALILKGAYTLIAVHGAVHIAGAGSVALAKAGSGDVLAGMTGALLVQGYSAGNAAQTAVLAHGTAAHQFKNNYALTPLQLIEAVQRL
ncbi:MAG: NAD(P)H-hydrate dehydratase, partial [Treponema sp.]|nr:NAD(P)H-hydrate dehydratase [Treponema sp.]